jgi:hypothetical protein
MYLTKDECKEMLQRFLQESIGLLNEYDELKKVYNLNDFNPNEKKMEKNQITLEELSKIINSLQKYMAIAFK